MSERASLFRQSARRSGGAATVILRPPTHVALRTEEAEGADEGHHVSHAATDNKPDEPLLARELGTELVCAGAWVRGCVGACMGCGCTRPNE